MLKTSYLQAVQIHLMFKPLEIGVSFPWDQKHSYWYSGDIRTLYFSLIAELFMPSNVSSMLALMLAQREQREGNGQVLRAIQPPAPLCSLLSFPGTWGNHSVVMRRGRKALGGESMGEGGKHGERRQLDCASIICRLPRSFPYGHQLITWSTFWNHIHASGPHTQKCSY